MIYPLEYLCLLLGELALQASLYPNFIVLASENFAAIGVGYAGARGHHAPYLVDHPIVLLLARANGGQPLWNDHLLIDLGKFHLHVLGA